MQGVVKVNSLGIIEKKFLPALSKVFTPIVLDSLTQKGYSPYLLEVCANSGFLNKVDLSMTLRSFFDLIYDLLFKYYRNEYIYKNVIANKILFGRHSIKTSNMLTEFRVGNNKADVVILNGTSSVYEIKSEYDTFNRLQNQLDTYLEIFDYVNVITTFSQANKLYSILPEKIGILVLTDSNTISIIKEAKSNKENFNPARLFDSFRKAEYTRIIKEYFGVIPDVPNTMIFDECKKLYSKIPPIVAHDLSFKILKERTNAENIKAFISKAPSSLSAYAMTISDQEKKVFKLLDLFDFSIESLFISELN